MNKAILIGNLGADPEVRNVNGDTVCKMRIATTDTFKDRDGNRKERTDWHNVQVWGPQGESCGKYLRKGSSVGVEGQIQTHSYDDKKTGEKRYATDIRALHVEFLDKKPKSDDAGDARESDRDTGRDERSGQRDNRGGGYRQDDRSRSNVSDRDAPRDNSRPPPRGRGGFSPS